jgi:hypothetical protein
VRRVVGIQHHNSNLTGFFPLIINGYGFEVEEIFRTLLEVESRDIRGRIHGQFTRGRIQSQRVLAQRQRCCTVITWY